MFRVSYLKLYGMNTFEWLFTLSMQQKPFMQTKAQEISIVGFNFLKSELML